MENNINSADVVALGELLIDFTQTGSDENGYPLLNAHPGGAPANFLGTLAKFGVKTALLGKIGNDSFGRLLRKTLDDINIDTRGLITDDSVFTTLAFVSLDSDGNRDFSFARKPGADTCLKTQEVDYSLIDNAKIFHFGSLSLTDEPSKTATTDAVRYAKEKHKLISYDPNLRKPLWNNLSEARNRIIWGIEQADIVKISNDEIKFLFGVTANEGLDLLIKQYHKKLVFVTCGEKGCYYGNSVYQGYIPSLKGINVIDTTGAGDIFAGSAVYKLLQFNKQPEELDLTQLKEIVSFASTAAGLSTTMPGGLSSIPEKAQIVEFLQSY